MKFSDTTNKDGLIQDCEFWCNLGDGGISGDTTLLKRFTGLINHAYDEALPIVFGADGKWQWDDHNHGDMPIATANLVSGQSDYPILTDDNGASILEIKQVMLLDPQSTWIALRSVDSLSDRNTDDILLQNASNVGTPYRYDKIGSVIRLDPVPDYSAASGLRVVFSRTPDYFTSADTTQTPGIPAHFHRLLSLIASHDWLSVNKSESQVLLTRVEAKIAKFDARLAEHMAKRAGGAVVRPRVESSR